MQLLYKSSILIRILLFVILLHILICNSNGNNFSIEIGRRRTSLETLINSFSKLKKFGIDFSNISGGNRTNDSVALDRYFDNEYFAQIRVGKPSQIMNVAFDTAWPASWLMSKQCPWSTLGCIAHNHYDHSKSSLYKKDGRPFSVEDEGFNLTGFFSYDTLYVSHINVTNQLFIEMTSVPYTYLFSKIDGIIGLGLQVDSYVPFIYNLLKQKKIANPIFSIYLNRDKQSDHGGNIIFGFIEKRHIHHYHIDNSSNIIYDEILYLQVKPGPFWEFDLDSVFVNGTKDKLSLCTSGCTALTDTSTNSIFGPPDQITQIHTIIDAKPWIFDGRYTVSCNLIPKLPKITFYIGGKPFTLKGRDYTIKISYKAISICLSAFVEEKYFKNQWSLGGAFLSEYYSIYDLDKKQIGLVKSA